MEKSASIPAPGRPAGAPPASPSDLERLEMRCRPAAPPLMRMTWGSLLFAHWRIDARLLRPLVPARLDIDEFDNSAWIGVIPFTMWGIRGRCLPPAPGLRAFHELNVRTYVHLDGEAPGVWFFSLDAASGVAVRAARAAYRLNYRCARISLVRAGDGGIAYTSRRTDGGAPPAELDAAWAPGAPIEFASSGGPPVDSAEFFLTERYCLYAAAGDRLWRARIHHEPWRLRAARVDSWRSTMVAALGLPERPIETPGGGGGGGGALTHHAEDMRVDVWPLRRV